MTAEEADRLRDGGENLAERAWAIARGKGTCRLVTQRETGPDEVVVLDDEALRSRLL